MVSTESPQMGLCSCRACGLVGEADNKQVKANVYLQILVSAEEETNVSAEEANSTRKRRVDSCPTPSVDVGVEVKTQRRSNISHTKNWEKSFSGSRKNLYKGPEAERLFLLKE